MNHKVTYKFVTTLVLLSTSLSAQVDCNQALNVQNFVKRFYVNVLHREADHGGLDLWVNKLTSNQNTGEDVAQGFIFSNEYNLASQSNISYVRTLYSAFFGRDADDTGLNAWIINLSQGMTKEEVLSGFLHSQEFINLSNGYGIQAFKGAAYINEDLADFVARFYTVVLDRSASEEEITYWTSKLNSGESTGADIAFGFIFSAEFDAEHKDNSSYINTLYSAFFNREADEAGFNGWIQNLEAGMSKREVLDNFLHSQEFINLANSYNILAFEGASRIDTDTTNTQNTPPIAKVGTDIQANYGDILQFSSKGSHDNDGSISCYLWHEAETILGTQEYITNNDLTTGKHKVELLVVDNDGSSASNSLMVTITEKPRDMRYDPSYKGLNFYYPNLSTSNYQLSQLTDDTFNAFSASKKLTIANNLLSTLFFGYPQNILLAKINSGTFISDIREGLKEDRTDKAWLESYILDDEKFRQYSRWSEPQAINILSRFYAMKKLDRYFLHNWTAYILTQTIMFSPAYELETTHTSNIANVYNRIVNFLNIESGMRYITYVHMMSEDNWRRFRSPEDNGREMLEIYLQDLDDSHVPIAGQALQNWKLNTDSDTLEVSLNQNRVPLSLFGTTITNGDDFYRELVKSDQFTQGVVQRLINFFFTEADNTKKLSLTQAIVSSHPETWQDILMQIIFSEEYLLHNPRAKSAEESFYSLAKKTNYKHHRGTFYEFKESLEEMHQASMKYKLGKLNRVPLDTLSYAYYHKYIREEVLLRNSNPSQIDNFSSWSRQGWGRELISLNNFTFNENNHIETLNNFINSLFKTIIYRDATQSELNLFNTHMTYQEDGETNFHWAFDMFDIYTDSDRQIEEREERRAYIAMLILDYLSRLETTYQLKEVN